MQERILHYLHELQQKALLEENFILVENNILHLKKFMKMASNK